MDKSLTAEVVFAAGDQPVGENGGFRESAATAIDFQGDLISQSWDRMHIRRRTGRTRITNEMDQYDALTAIFSNRADQMYVKDIGRTEIVEEFVDLLEDWCSVEDWLSKLNFSNPMMTPVRSTPAAYAPGAQEAASC